MADLMRAACMRGRAPTSASYGGADVSVPELTKTQVRRAQRMHSQRCYKAMLQCFAPLASPSLDMLKPCPPPSHLLQRQDPAVISVVHSSDDIILHEQPIASSEVIEDSWQGVADFF